MNHPAKNTKNCPSQDDLRALLDGSLDQKHELTLESHVATCTICGQTLEDLCQNEQADHWKYLADHSDGALSAVHEASRAVTTRHKELDSLRNVPVLNGFDVLSVAGRGGMGVVYKARQLSLNRDVAIKMLHSSAPDDLERIVRFKNEADSIASIQHPGVISIYEINEHDGVPFIVLEYIRGPNLSKLIKTSAPFDNFSTAQLAQNIAMAVDAAHQKNLIHRDLKPANVLMQVTRAAAMEDFRLQDFIPKITDFGLAKSFEFDNKTQTSVLVGTPIYMAPEQITCPDDWAQPTVDVYAIGVILYELLTGRVPFSAKTTFELFKKIEADEPVALRALNSNVNKDLEAICLKCLEKSPQARYPTARLLAEDLNRFQRGEPVSARRSGLLSRSKKWVTRHKLQVALGVVFLAAAIFLGSLLANISGQRHEAVQNFDTEMVLANDLFVEATRSELLELEAWEPARQAIIRARETQLAYPELIDRDELEKLSDDIDLHIAARKLAFEFDNLKFAHFSKTIEYETYASAVRQAFDDFGLSPEKYDVERKSLQLSDLDNRSLEGVLSAVYQLLLSGFDIEERAWFEELAYSLDYSQWRRDSYQAFVGKDKTAMLELIEQPDLQISASSLVSFAAPVNFKVGVNNSRIVEFLKACHLRYPSSYWLNYWLAHYIRNCEHPRNAIPYCRAIVAQRDTPATRLYLGNTYMDMLNWGEAIREYQEVLEQDPEFRNVYPAIARCHQELKEYDLAIQYYQLAIDQGTTDSSVRGYLLHTYIDAGHSDKAKAFAAELIARTTSDHETYHSKAIAHIWLENLSEAVANYELALEAEPFCLRCLMGMADVYLKKHELANARLTLEKSLSMMPSSVTALKKLASICVEQHDFESAITYAKQRLDVSPTNTRFLSDLADIYMKSGKLNLAEETYYRAQTFADNNIYSLIQIFKIYERQGKFESAESVLRRAIFAVPDSESAHYKLVKFLLQMDELEKAKESSDEFINRLPNCVTAHFAAYKTAYAMKDFDGARAAFETGRKLDTIPPTYFTSRRWVELISSSKVGQDWASSSN